MLGSILVGSHWLLGTFLGTWAPFEAGGSCSGLNRDRAALTAQAQKRNSTQNHPSPVKPDHAPKPEAPGLLMTSSYVLFQTQARPADSPFSVTSGPTVLQPRHPLLIREGDEDQTSPSGGEGSCWWSCKEDSSSAAPQEGPHALGWIPQTPAVQWDHFFLSLNVCLCGGPSLSADRRLL